MTLSLPAALQLGTAILYKADEFHTFDEFDNLKTRAAKARKKAT